MKSVDSVKNCSLCNGKVVKYGFSKAKKQRFKCKNCSKTQVQNYQYSAYLKETNAKIIVFVKEGLGIRSISRILKISTNTLLKRIIKISNCIVEPELENQKTYEVDELCTFVNQKNKRIWVVYAFERESKKIVSFNVGSRSNLTLKPVIKRLLNVNPLAIFTDKLKNYRSMITKKLHKTNRFGTNHIERFNLTLRTHIKRLNRKTICFSKSEVFLVAILRIYFWTTLPFFY
ncbi:IS1 family transposase [Flavobacterium sp. xlx-214]|nr:IS1 family transposase [Flavobacterium sp. xlx-221]QMI84975.1 IS1 family transposase [Flavobacterium sp. xlx-214]